jgi:CheY-like chemotaxis protein
MNTQKILLVDDDPEVLALMANLLDQHGFQCLKASNGKEALSILAKQSVHVVITDVMMPVMDGIEFTKSLGDQFPVVMVTGHKNLKLAGKVEDLCECFLDKLDLNQNLVKATEKAIERYHERASWPKAKMVA